MPTPTPPDSIVTLTRELLELARALVDLHEQTDFDEPLDPWRLRRIVADAIADRQPLPEVLREVAPATAAPWEPEQPATSRPHADGIDLDALRAALLRALLDHEANGGTWMTAFHVTRLATNALQPGAWADPRRSAPYQSLGAELLSRLCEDGLLAPHRGGLRLTLRGRSWLAAHDARMVHGET